MVPKRCDYPAVYSQFKLLCARFGVTVAQEGKVSPANSWFLDRRVSGDSYLYRIVALAEAGEPGRAPEHTNPPFGLDWWPSREFCIGLRFLLTDLERRRRDARKLAPIYLTD